MNRARLRPRLLVRLLLLAGFGPALLFLASGDSGWAMGWIFAIFTFMFSLGSRLFLLRRNPQLFNERFEAMRKDNVEPWDRVLVPFLGIFLPTLTVLLAGLDRRFGWSTEFPVWLQAGAYLPILLGALFALRAALENAFFSAVVRIQEDRGHKVVTTGPYRLVRHPGYAGGLLFNLFIPVALGSLWAFLPVLVQTALTVLRTALEDRTLIRKLPGYRDYADKTRKRLIPGIW